MTINPSVGDHFHCTYRTYHYTQVTSFLLALYLGSLLIKIGIIQSMC